MAYARIARNCNVATMVCVAAHAAGYRAYAIRPYKRCKTYTAKTTFDIGKTMSDVGKITSDIIQTTSDLFLLVTMRCKSKSNENAEKSSDSL